MNRGLKIDEACDQAEKQFYSSFHLGNPNDSYAKSSGGRGKTIFVDISLVCIIRVYVLYMYLSRGLKIDEVFDQTGNRFYID